MRAETIPSWLQVLAVILFPAMIASADDASTDPAIDRWISRQASAMHGVERKEARYPVIGDLDGDGRDDVAVLYTIEGSGRTKFRLRYLAAFHRGARALRYRAHALVGGRGIREVNRVTILNGTIVVETLEYRRGDAPCCPGRYATHRYRLRASRLVPLAASRSNLHR